MPTAHNNNIGLSISGSVNGGGIKHFTNWDAGLTSIEFDQKEKFIAKQATKFLTGSTFYDQLGDPLKINFGADNVKIVDNFAAVSYPEYTDLAKSSFYFNDSHVYTIYDPDLYGGAANSLPSGFVYIPIFRFKELEKIINKEFIPSTYNNAGTDVEAVDLTGSFIVLHYHDDSLYAGPVEPQVLKYHRTLDLSEIEIGEFTLARIKAFGSIWLEQMSSNNAYDEDEFIIVANIGTDYKTVVKPTNAYYTPNCCSMVEIPPPPPPPPPPGGCTNAYWTNYMGEGEGRYIQITGVAGTEFTINLNESYSGGIYNTGITEEDIDHWAFLNLPVGVDQLYEIITFSTSTSPGSYVATAEIYNICQEGPHDTIQFNIELGFGGSAPSNTEPQNDDKQLFGSANEIGSIPCDIEFIKYKPIIGCGKVDVYYINKGVITDYTNQIATCTNHHLKSGDIIRIFGVLGIGNGSFYVDPITENTFNIYLQYNNGNFIDKINLDVSENVQFIKIGNVLDSNETTWQLHSSLTSPRGRNGYGALFNMATQETIGKTGSEFVTKFNLHKRFWCDTTSKLPDCFNNTENFDQIFARDYGLTDAEFLSAQINPIDRTESILLSSPKLIGFERWPVDVAGPGGTYKNSTIWSGDDPQETIDLDFSKDFDGSFPFDPYIEPWTKANLNSCDRFTKVRPLHGIYDIWNTAYNLVNNFYFGASIDFKKDEVNNKYLLLVGERGFDTLFSLNPPTTTSPNDQAANVYYQLPQYGHGAAYLFEIKDVHDVNEEDDPNIKSPSQRVVLSDYYTAYKNDDDIAVPEPLVSAPFDQYLDLGGVFGYKRRYIFDTMWSNHTIARNSNLRSYPNCLYQAIPFPDSDNTDYLTMRGDRFPNGHPLFLGDNVVVAQQDLLNVNWGKIETETGHEYWYGSMLYGLANIKNGSTIYTHNKLSLVPPYYTEINSCTNSYFFNLPILTIPNSSNINDIYVNNVFNDQTLYEPNLSFRRNSFDVYPYVDNFGKSVALDIIDGDLYVFASSRTKPVINRSQIDGNCSDENLLASYVGYIHVFKNGIKTQKIYETQAITFPSRKWQGQYYKADKFAICMYADKGKLFWGQAKGIELLEIDQTWTNETSKIFIYENQNDIYTKTHTIENYNDRHISYLINIDTVPDHKEYRLRNKLSNFTNNTTAELTFYPSDRFGSCFKVDKNLLVTNAFDNQNELDAVHTAENSATGLYNGYNKTCDYLHVYTLLNDIWQYTQKIAPAFNKDNAEYQYNSILFPSVNKSIKNLGNITYSNNVENSRTWDLDLTNSFAIADDRIILKDPISYSIFERDFSIVKNDVNFLNLPAIQNLTVNPKQYFTYDEEFSAKAIPSIDHCNELIFTSLNGLYTFNYEPEDYKDVLYRNSIINDNVYLDILTPVYFISLPQINFEFANINSIKFIVEEIVAEPSISAGLTDSSLRMVVFTKDPRTTIYPTYLSYNNLCQIDTNYKVKSRFIPENTPHFYRGGAFDAYQYTENSFDNNSSDFSFCANSLCLAQTFIPSYTSGGGLKKVHQFDITKSQFDLSSLLIKGDMLLNSSDNRAFTNGSIVDTLEFDDLEKYGYDSSIPVENTLIIGFIFNVPNTSYQITTAPVNLESGIRINTIEASIRYNFSSTPNFIDNNGASLRTYKCVLNKVFDFGYIASDTICFNDSYNNFSIYNDSILLYNKPVLGIGNSNIGLSQTRSEIYDGATTKTLELISLDNYNNATNELEYTYSRHFNIQPLEYLPLLISGASRFPYKSTTFHINGPLQITTDSILFIKAKEPLNLDTTLHMFGPLSSIEDINLNIKGHRILTTPYLDYPYLFIRGAYLENKDINLHMLGFEPADIPLFIKGPLTKTKTTALFTKSLEYNNNLSLLLVGHIIANGDMRLLMQNNIVLKGLNLKIAGPIPFDSNINSKNHICEIVDRNSLFDISNNAESIIDLTNKNSISFNKNESKASQLTYASKDIENIILINNNSADDDLYLTYKDNQSIAVNDNYLCVASNVDQISAQNISYWDGKHSPKIYIYELNSNIEANLVYTYNNLLFDLQNVNTNGVRNNILSGSVYLDSNISYIDISSDNYLAVSINITVRNIVDNSFVGYISCILILHSHNNQWLCVDIISQESKSYPLVDLLTGSYLQWVGSNLYYSVNSKDKIDDAIKIAIYDASTYKYNTNDININFKATDLYNFEYITNLNSGYLADTHYGFGYKFIIDNDLMFVAAPMVDPYWSNNLAMGSVSNSHCGVIFVFKLIDEEWLHVNTLYNDGYLTLNDATNRSGVFIQKLFGYDLDYSSEFNTLIVSQPLTKNVYRFNIENNGSANLLQTFYKNETGYGNSIAICNSQLIALSKSDNGILYYGPNDYQNFVFDSSLINNELSQYLTKTADSLTEKIINFKSVNIKDQEYILILRKFNILYTDDTTDVVQKISLLNLNHLINATLFMKVPILSSKDFSQFISGPVLSDKSLKLKINGFGKSINQTTLFISNFVRQINPLFIKSKDPTSHNNLFNLFIYSSTLNSIFKTENFALFMQARNSLSKDISGVMPLQLAVDSTGYASNNAPLWIGSILRYNNNNISLFNYGSSSPSIAIDNIINNSTTLFMSSRGYLKDFNASLFIESKIGGQLLNLVMFNQGTENNFSLFTNAVYGSNNNLSFILFSKDATLGINTFIRGYRS